MAVYNVGSYELVSWSCRIVHANRSFIAVWLSFCHNTHSIVIVSLLCECGLIRSAYVVRTEHIIFLVGLHYIIWIYDRRDVVEQAETSREI